MIWRFHPIVLDSKASVATASFQNRPRATDLGYVNPIWFWICHSEPQKSAGVSEIPTD